MCKKKNSSRHVCQKKKNKKDASVLGFGLFPSPINFSSFACPFCFSAVVFYLNFHRRLRNRIWCKRAKLAWNAWNAWMLRLAQSVDALLTDVTWNVVLTLYQYQATTKHCGLRSGLCASFVLLHLFIVKIKNPAMRKVAITTATATFPFSGKLANQPSNLKSG